jgi:hypothetical protein
VIVNDSYVHARTYKSTNGIASHCKELLDIAIVYHGVYHALESQRLAELSQLSTSEPVKCFGISRGSGKVSTTK